MLYPDGTTGKYIYCSKQSRNPNNPKIESEFTLLTTRSKGFDYHESKATPLGNPVLVRTKKDKPDVVGNCHLFDLFNLARSNNAEVDICGRCKFQSACRKESGDGFGFKKQISNTLKATKLRANIQGLSPEIIGNNAVLVVDEYAQSVEWVSTLFVTKAKISKLMNRYADNGLDLFGDWIGQKEDFVLYQILKKLEVALRLAKTKRDYRYGIDLHTAKEIFKIQDIASEDIEKLV